MLRIIGKARWRDRVAELREQIEGGRRYARLLAQRHAAELAYEKGRNDAPLSPAERRLAKRVGALDSLDRSLSPSGRTALRSALQTATSGPNTLMPLLHLHRTAQLHEASGYTVRYAGFEDGTNFDLLIARDATEAEIACDTFSAEDGHNVHRAAWTRLVDQIDPDLQTWLAAHPGRYLLKMTLPNGLRNAESDAGMATDAEKLPDESVLATLHRRITEMLKSAKRADHDEAAVLRLDPLMLAAAQADENGLLARLRSEFGPEANLAITAGGQSVFVLAARAGTENEVAVAMRRRLAAIAPARLTGTRPGILAMFVEDTDRLEWRLLREKLTLEGEARHFLTFPEARAVVAVTCASRFELAGNDNAETAMRFRNPSHPAAKLPALADAVVSIV